MGAHRRYKRDNLFLLRLWSEDAADGSGRHEWRGNIQRVTNGESQEFSSLQSLLESLLTMLPDDSGAKPTYPQSEIESIHS